MNFEADVKPLLNGESPAIERCVQLLFDALGNSPNPDAHLVLKDGASVTIYVLAGGSVHELRGETTQPPRDDLNKPDAEWDCDYSVHQVTPLATYSLKVTRKGVMDATIHNWTFQLAPAAKPIFIALNPRNDHDDPLDRLKARFAGALAEAVTTVSRQIAKP